MTVLLKSYPDNIGEIRQLDSVWRARLLRAQPARNLTDLEKLQLQIMMVAVGGPGELRRLITKLDDDLKASQGRPAEKDTQWLLLAALLKRSNKTLSRKAAIQKVAEIHHVRDMPNFVRRLLRKLEGHSFEGYAEAVETARGRNIRRLPA
jgi:DNA-binding response OmpR family regulator